MELAKQEIEELIDAILKEVDCLVTNYLEVLKSIESIEIRGLTYEETLELRIQLLEACKESQAQASLLFHQLLNNLESCLQKTIEKECLLGFVSMVLLARNNPQGYKILEEKGKRALGKLRIEEDIKDILLINKLGEVLQFQYPNHMEKISALQYFPNRFKKAAVDLLRKRYVPPKIPVSFVRDDNVRDEKEFTVEFLKRKDSAKEAEILIVEFMKTLSPQGKSQREVEEFLLYKLKSGEIDGYLKETESGSRIDTKKLRKYSGKPLRTVERFLKGLNDFANKN